MRVFYERLCRKLLKCSHISYDLRRSSTQGNEDRGCTCLALRKDKSGQPCWWQSCYKAAIYPLLKEEQGVSEWLEAAVRAVE